MEKHNEVHSKCEEWSRTPQPDAEAGEGVGREKERARLAGVWQFVFFFTELQPQYYQFGDKSNHNGPI